MPKILIHTNLYGLIRLAQAYPNFIVTRYPVSPRRVWEIIAEFWTARNCHYLILNFVSRDYWILGFMKLLLPFTRVKLVTLDLLLTRPHNVRDKFFLLLKRALLRRAHKFIVFQRDTNCYECKFRIPGNRFHYLPYKIDSLEIIKTTRCDDLGYIFCGGQSRRDFATLAEAVKSLPYPARIVTTTDGILAKHGSSLNAADLPDHINTVRLDGSVQPFVREMAGARLVVIPIKKGVMTQSGIAVSIMAMAMGKCVIATYGPGISDVLPPGTSIVVPPGDAPALRAAIEAAWTDETLRLKVAEAGRKYATTLQGTDRLLKDVANWVVADHKGSTVADRTQQLGG